MKLLNAFAAALLLAAFLHADDPKARALMEQVDARDDGDNMTGQSTMILIDKNGDRRIRKMKRFIKDKEEDVLSMVFFLEPADVRETGFLTYDYDDPAKDDDQWLYLPALKKSKRIANDDKSGSFMGSDLSYGDMTKPDLENYDYKILGEKEVDGHKATLIEAVPRTEKVVDTYGYTKSILFVRPDISMVVRALHYVKEGSKLKYYDVTGLEKIDGVWTATEIQVTTKKGKRTLHKTVLQVSDVKYGQPLEESMFSVRTLEKGL